MSSFEFLAALLLLAAILGIVSHRYFHLPRTIALMAGSLVLSVIIILIDRSVTSVELRGIAVLTWGGLRGGISVALALSLEPSPYRGALLAVCYAVVVFTILVQSLTMPMLIRRLYRPTAAQPRSP
jgi:CPA1 family monovalent cation:H+ antiporter